MATAKQKEAARKNLEKARAARSAQAKSRRSPAKGSGGGMSVAQKDRLRSTQFTFPKERKEPIHDAAHVRNAIARFDQVEGVSDAERTEAWKRINRAAERFGVEVEADSWHELFDGGTAKKR